MKTLVMDQSTTASGYSIWQDGILNNIGLLKNKSNEKDKFTQMIKMLQELFKNEKPDKIILEDVYNLKSVKTIIILARLQGFIISYCILNNIDYDVIHPKTWKSGLGITVKGSKNQKQKAIELCENNTGLDVSNDEADAYCIGFYYFNKS